MGVREQLIEILGRRCRVCGNTNMIEIGILPKNKEKELTFDEEFYNYYLTHRYEATQTLVAICCFCSSEPFTGLSVKETSAKIIKDKN